MRRDGAHTLHCVAAVRYRFLHEGKPGAQTFYLDLVGIDNPSDHEEGWPATSFRLMWCDDRAAY